MLSIFVWVKCLIVFYVLFLFIFIVSGFSAINVLERIYKHSLLFLLIWAGDIELNPGSVVC